MRAGRALFAFCAFAASASAFAIPAAPDEAGVVRNPPRWETDVTPATPAAQDNVDAYFARYDVNRDGVVSWDEAQADPELVRVFARADTDNNGVLTREEFQTAAVLAANERTGRSG